MTPFLLLAFLPAPDTFDRYTNPVLAQATDSAHVKAIPKLTPKLVADHHDLFQETGGVLLIVKTNAGNHAKLLAQFARQKVDPTKSVPMALLERATSYKPGAERAIQAVAPLVHLYNGFQFNLDLGQVVAPDVGGDLRYVDTPDGGYLEPVKDAKLYLVTKHLPGTEPKKPPGRTVLGEAFDPASIPGTYTLHDDGRRTAQLDLQLDAEGNLTGGYTSTQTGRRYDVTGKLTPTAKHQLTFQVKFPNSVQEFSGHVFTKDAAAIAGTTKLQGQEFAFYAVREK
jgi:hypothetical protein